MKKKTATNTLQAQFSQERPPLQNCRDVVWAEPGPAARTI